MRLMKRIGHFLCTYGFGGVYKEKYLKFGKPGNYNFLKLRWIFMFLFEGGVSAEDFFIYHLYEKKCSERKKFVTLYKSGRINKLLNRDCRRELVEDKSLFGQYFSDFLYRNQISTIGIEYADFLEFYKNERRIFAKPCFGCNGDGAFIIEEGIDDSALQAAFILITKEPYVLESVLTQDGLLYELNPHTLNTIRVNVLNNHGDMKIVNAILRTGQGEAVTDNICAGGCVSEIDVESGRFITKFVDLSNHIYDTHPQTGVSLLGKVCPAWEEVKKTAFEATRRLPGATYASWDIAVITNNRVAIVEGNTWGNFNIQQVPRQIGLLPYYSKFVAEWKEKEKSLVKI